MKMTPSSSFNDYGGDILIHITHGVIKYRDRGWLQEIETENNDRDNLSTWVARGDRTIRHNQWAAPDKTKYLLNYREKSPQIVSHWKLSIE